MAKPKVDYTLYLVTDSTAAILAGRSLTQVVESVLRGGVTVVQLRDKHGSPEDVIKTAREVHAVTERYRVPLLINDRVDVAVSVGCAGVHLGQDDMDFARAREMLGEDKVIGVTVHSTEEAVAACEAGADYLGIAAVFATPTKKDSDKIIGPGGVREILSALDTTGHGAIPAVCIGGITAANAGFVLQTVNSGTKKCIDGLAVVRALMAAPDPAAAARDLTEKVLVAKMPHAVMRVGRLMPLTHNMTNSVVQNFAANVALAIGASPIMSRCVDEVDDLARHGGALVINMGTLMPDDIGRFIAAVQAYNAAGRPVVLDPVGAGATGFRRKAAHSLLTSGRFTVIKGNLSEMLAISGEATAQRGVDSADSLTVSQRARLVCSLARKYECIVMLTGLADVISDGRRTVRVDSGHALLGAVTGTGCALGTVVSAMVAACGSSDGDRLAAVIGGAAMFGVAAKMAASRDDVRGPGTFVPALIDELYRLRKATAGRHLSWLALAGVQVMEVDLF